MMRVVMCMVCTFFTTALALPMVQNVTDASCATGYTHMPGTRGGCGDLQKHGIPGWQKAANNGACADLCSAAGVCNSYRYGGELCCLYGEDAPDPSLNWGTDSTWDGSTMHYCSKIPPPHHGDNYTATGVGICRDDNGLFPSWGWAGKTAASAEALCDANPACSGYFLTPAAVDGPYQFYCNSSTVDGRCDHFGNGGGSVTGGSGKPGEKAPPCYIKDKAPAPPVPPAPPSPRKQCTTDSDCANIPGDPGSYCMNYSPKKPPYYCH